MEIPSKYDPVQTEDKWYKFWLDNKLFRSEPKSGETPYTIVIPPPNVTGVLHMGHMLNNTIQDILIRRARMIGFNALWVPGTDHASIATEARVVAKLKSEGLDKKQIGREEFLNQAWKWKNKHGGIILEQLKKLGASCDWERTRFTMDEDMSESVIKVFVDLHKKGYIYRGIRMVNWDPQAKTAVSDEEVLYREVKSKLYYVRYKIAGEEEFVTIATTRPETILGDTAVCVNPGDNRYHYLKGKKVIVPMVNRVIPIIEDDYVDIEFGTGCLKITPAHDVNDYEIGLRHNLEIIDIFNDDGTMSPEAKFFTGTDRFEARDLAVKELEKEGLLVKTEEYVNKIGYSERTDAIIEPKLSTQWFLRMNEISKPALDNVMNGQIRLIPSKFKNTYRHWMENVKDWCISRQLWWGHRIPAYYINNSGDYVVAESAAEALQLAKEKTGNANLTVSDLNQDDDVLDTWFSSWLWPISVFDGIRNPDNKDIKYYYPTDDLITAPEILFFWVARMIIAGYEYMHEKPFKNVYLTGLVRDSKRRKMSKSLGNSPDPLELISKYSADGVRVGMLLCSPAGNDLLFDESLPEQGRNFANKIWNAFRLVKSWKTDSSALQPEHAKEAIIWFYERLKKGILDIDLCFKKYRISDALMQLYRLFWDDFASIYLEIIKPEGSKTINSTTYNETIKIFENLLKLLHPFMPFITEEIWHLIIGRFGISSIMTERMPDPNRTIDYDYIEYFEETKNVISALRKIRNENNIPGKEKIDVYVKKKDNYNENFDSIIKKLVNISRIIFNKPDEYEITHGYIGKYAEYEIIVSESRRTKEIKKLEAELEYTTGFLESVMKKLNNESFINGAPAKVIDTEQKKKTDAESKIKGLKERLLILKKNNHTS